MISLLSDRGRGFYDSAVTHVPVTAPTWKLCGGGVFFIGSCFAEYLYREYRDTGLSSAFSPFGNIYNPESMAAAAEMLSSGRRIQEGDCFERGGSFYHHMFHSLKSGKTPAELSRVLNNEMDEAAVFIRKAEAVIITAGTSIVYRLKDGNGAAVNNCHKLPAQTFDRCPLSPEEAFISLRDTVNHLKALNPGLKFIITLSPVRHLRDDPAENSLSKAVLRCAIDSLCREYPEDLWYFPSYEIMLDELRDYRWYAKDRCHPTDEAISYIISRFITEAYEGRFLEFLREYLPVLRDLSHKPRDPDSEAYRTFKSKAELKRKLIKSKYPDILSR